MNSCLLKSTNTNDSFSGRCMDGHTIGRESHRPSVYGRRATRPAAGLSGASVVSSFSLLPCHAAKLFPPGHDAALLSAGSRRRAAVRRVTPPRCCPPGHAAELLFAGSRRSPAACRAECPKKHFLSVQAVCPKQGYNQCSKHTDKIL